MNFLSFSSVAFAQLPTVCNSEFKDKVSPYIQDLEKAGPTALIQKIRKSKSSELIEYHMSYGQNIRNKWFYGKGPQVELMKMYNAAGIHHVDDMSQDLIEGIWVNNGKERCQILNKEHEQLKKDRERATVTPDQEPKK